MKLIIINGTAGVGKSTLAEKLHELLPLSFLVNVDAQRRFISQYRENAKESNDLAFEVLLAITEACLKSKRDVIVDKMIWNINSTLDTLSGLGEKYSAEVHEIILEASKETVVRRVDGRGYKPGGLLTPEKVDRFWEETQKLKHERPNALVIDTDNLTAEQVLERVKSLVFK